jgi:hypothetical protein
MRVEFGTNDERFRVELGQIVDRYIGDQAGDQIDQIATLALKHPHSICVVREAIPGKQESFRFNCYQHSFSLVDIESVTRIMRMYGSIFPGREFVQFLIDARLHEINVEEANDGDHVIYAAGSRIEHAGKVSQGMIESKWGLAHLWRHRVYEVPWAYGNVVRVFSRLSQEESVRAFLDYAAGRGVVKSLV